MKIVALSLAGVLVAGAIGLIAWTQIGVMAAEESASAAVAEDPAVTLTDEGGNVVMSPTGIVSDVGLVFFPGAKVEADAYAAKLRDLVASEGITVVITRTWLNLAFFDARPLSTFTDAAPQVDTWVVGGHSLRGVRACQLAAEADALLLFAAYCANDLSESGLPVLSIAGSEDGLTTATDIDDARDNLPEDAAFVEIAGASHASFGDYGTQSGDGDPTITDAEMAAEIAASVRTLLGRL